MTRTIVFLSVLAVAACGGSTGSEEPQQAPAPTAAAGASAAPAPSAEEAIERALGGDHRSAEHRARDPYRHPRETLAFFGLRPDQRVVEMAPGGGWYTEVLAPVLRDHGKLTVAIRDPEDASYYGTYLEKLEASPQLYDRVEPIVFEPPERSSLGPDGSADLVLTFRSVHGWVNRAQAPAVFAAMFQVLRPGGVLGVVQHRAEDGADPSETAPQGYVPESHVIQLAEEAGFVLDERSDLNRNPADTHEHPEGVWTLPPSLRLGDVDRARYEAIGESDRMTLRFRKPG
ncbi:MAG: class I SAM-dependent methyltransferase [Sandaracinaceae bacterium]